MLIEIIEYAADLLRADPYFSDIPVLSEDLGDPANSIDTYLTKRTGIGVIVMTPKANVKHQNLPGPYFEDIIFIASVWENVTLNRAADGSGTGKKALAVAETIAAILDKKPSAAGVAETFTAMTPTIALVPNTSPFLAYNVLYRTNGGVDYQINKVATPVVTVSGATYPKTISIACATAPAYTFFTTDGSYPAPLDGNGKQRTPYSNQFTVNSPTTIKCRAWLPGMLASQLVTTNV